MATVRAYEAGSDHHLARDSTYLVIGAVITAVARRSVDSPTSRHLHVGELHINTAARTVDVDGRNVQLSRKVACRWGHGYTLRAVASRSARLERRIAPERDPGATRPLPRAPAPVEIVASPSPDGNPGAERVRWPRRGRQGTLRACPENGLARTSRCMRNTSAPPAWACTSAQSCSEDPVASASTSRSPTTALSRCA
jgi:hypothetical protein